MTDYNLEKRKCAGKKCPNHFRVLPTSKQEWCSRDCLIVHFGFPNWRLKDNPQLTDEEKQNIKKARKKVRVYDNLSPRTGKEGNNDTGTKEKKTRKI